MKYQLEFNGESVGDFSGMEDCLNKCFSTWMTETKSWLGDYKEDFYLEIKNNRGDKITITKED